MQTFTQQMVDSIFSFGELGFQEFETNRYLIDILKKNGFTVQKGVAGIPTAFVASWGSGKPVIALGSDIDGIPQASQKPGVAYSRPLIEGAPGHGEGHNSGQALNITAALAVKKIMEREKLPGTIRIWTGTAEELVGTKAYFVRAGLFKDVDVALFTHVGSDLGVSWGDRDGTGLVSVQYSLPRRDRARGRRAVARPQRARRRRADGHRLELPPRAPAARAALALRDHRRRRSAERRAAHGVGLVLLPRRRRIRRSRSCGRPATTIAKGAAMMTGTELLPTKVLGSAWPQHFNKASPRRRTPTSRRSGCPHGARPTRRSPRRSRRSSAAASRGSR